MTEERVVYRHLDGAGLVLYVGSVAERGFRVRQATHVRRARWWRFVACIEVSEPHERCAGFHAETAAIWRDQPIFNRTSADCEQERREADYLQERRDVPPAALLHGTRLERGIQIDRILADLTSVGIERNLVANPADNPGGQVRTGLDRRSGEGTVNEEEQGYRDDDPDLRAHLDEAS